MTFFWREGVLVTVDSDALGTPRSFVWDGREHAVCDVVQRWRLDSGWWRQRVWREYFLLCTHSGLLVILYLDVPARRWYLQRLYD